VAIRVWRRGRRVRRIRGGRQAIFWQTARTSKQARPEVSVPSARAAGIPELEIVVDSHERYPFRFQDQHVVTRRAALAAGDYGILVGGSLVASVERKSLADLMSSMTTGKLKYQLADLAAVPRAALVVEDRYSQVFKSQHVRPAVVADGLAVPDHLAARADPLPRDQGPGPGVDLPVPGRGPCRRRAGARRRARRRCAGPRQAVGAS
jgi:hypothetical protein